MQFTDLIRSYISEELILYSGLFAAVPGLVFMIALLISILRIHSRIKQDGKEPPVLHFLNLAFYFAVLVSSHKSSAKALQKERALGITERSAVFVTTTLVYPYVKPIDRFIARAWITFGALFGVFAVLFYWLYKG